MALVSSLLLLWGYYITFSSLVNGVTEEITEKMWENLWKYPAGRSPCRDMKAGDFFPKSGAPAAFSGRRGFPYTFIQRTLSSSLRRGAVSSSRHSTSSGIRSL